MWSRPFVRRLARHLLVLAKERRELERLEPMLEQNPGRLAHLRISGHQAQVVRGTGLGNIGLGKVWIDVEVEPWRTLLDPAQHQVLDRVETNRAQSEGHA